ncbi:MAG: hypothetical protein U5L08_16435 [Xanthomonadales bacterium]|nr:hypothetical protein [Xanthomonadales bacterium]
MKFVEAMEEGNMETAEPASYGERRDGPGKADDHTRERPLAGPESPGARCFFRSLGLKAFRSAVFAGLLSTLLIAVPTDRLAAQYVANQHHCLTVETEDTVGDMAYLVNRCSEELKVTYCFGLGSCFNSLGTGATTVGPRSKRTIAYDHDEYRGWSLIAFACRASVAFDDCQNAQREFFQYKNPDGPRR